tara:strand:- start:27914 stop:28447 length:534 start_codon:yes stop_codon:yes gene_type:complete
MKARLLLTATAAALTLTACGSSTDEELKDEALSIGDVTPGSGDLKLAAGQYSSKVELVEFDLPGLPDDLKKIAERAFADGASEPSLSCVTEDSTPEQWISEMNESDCEATDFTQSGNSFSATMECKDPEGLNGTVDFEGTVQGDNVQMEARFEQVIPEMGTAKMHMRVNGTRVGDCS